MQMIRSQHTAAGFIVGFDGKQYQSTIVDALKKQYHFHQIFSVHQIHSDIIHENSCGDGDGIIITQQHSLALIRTADCFPVVLCDNKKHLAGIFHSGWRGTEQHIVSKGISRLRELGATSLHAVIFPGIKQCCFEIGAELKERFAAANIPVYATDGRLTADLKDAIKQQLAQEIVSDIEDMSECTFCNTHYFSYRRDRDVRRHLSFVVL